MVNLIKINPLLRLILIWNLLNIQTALSQSIEFKGEVPLYEKKIILNEMPKKKEGFWKHWRATCINSRGAILRKNNKGFRDCMDNTGPNSGPRNNVKKSLDFMIEIKF